MRSGRRGTWGAPDFIDNVMCLIGGDQKDEIGWTQVMPWVRSLTRRSIGQLWLHDMGHDDGRSYGTKTRDQLVQLFVVAS